MVESEVERDVGGGRRVLVYLHLRYCGWRGWCRIRTGFLVKHGIPALTAILGVDEMYRAGSVGWRSVGGYGYGMTIGNGMPQSSIRAANPREMGK